MRIFLKKFSILFLIYVAIVYAVSFSSLYILRHSSFYKSSFLVNQVEEDKFDYIVLGASDGLTALNTKVIDSTLSIKGLNLSMDDTSLTSNYLMLQHFIAEGKSTKYCILVSAPSGFDETYNAINNNDYRFLMYQNRTYVSDFYNQFSDKKAKILQYSKWMPFVGLSYYNAELLYPSLMCLVKPNTRNRFDDKGNYTYPVIKSDNILTEFDEVSLQFSNTYIEKIKTLCDQNNIELICYVPPLKSIKVISKSSNYALINHSHTLINSKYFYDKIHVNSLGRQLTSLNFAADFKPYINP